MQNSSFDMKALVARLESMSDPGYREFNLSLVPGIKTPSLGIRIPALRSLGRELLKGDWRAFLEASRSHPLFEVRMLHSIVLGGAKCPIAEMIDLLDRFLPCVDNWAVCDTLCSSLKPRASDKDALFSFVCDCAASDEEFRKRFAFVMMMNRYREDEYASRVLAAYRSFSHPGYYARMGAAWGLATLFLYQREGVLEILRSGVLDDFTHNKAIQKARESFRVSDEDKRMLAGLRRPVPRS